VRGSQQASTEQRGEVFARCARTRRLTADACGSLPLFCYYIEKGVPDMKKSNTKKLALAGVLCAVAVVGSMFSFPVFGSKCAPVQHMVNVLCAVLLGPWYGVGAAFVASLLRNLLGLGSLMAFPGSMCGALLCGIVYHKTHKLLPTLIGEVFGTGIIGGLLAWPVAILFMGKAAGDIAFYAYIVPFLVSTVGGSIIAGIILFALEKNGTLKSMQNALNK
jgi:energy coupling factor transporter S component ThiW